MDTNTPLVARFSGNGGYEGDREAAQKAGFIRGHRYEVEKVEVHSWYTNLILRGVRGRWNSCLFDVDYSHPMFQKQEAEPTHA